MERIARDSEELGGLLRDLNARGVAVEFVTEALTFHPQDALALERELALLSAGQRFIRAGDAERQRIGINKAIRKPRSYNGRPLKLSHKDLVYMKERLDALGRNPSDSITKIAKDFHVSRETVYRYERAMDELILAARQTKRAKEQRYRGNDEKAARTEKDGIVKRRAAFAHADGLSVAEVRSTRLIQSDEAIPKPSATSDDP
jgi:hypothetical protein